MKHNIYFTSSNTKILCFSTNDGHRRTGVAWNLTTNMQLFKSYWGKDSHSHYMCYLYDLCY